MVTRVAIGSQSTVSGGASLTTSSPSATANNHLVLIVSWGLSVDPGSAQATPAITGWTQAQAPTSAYNSVGVPSGSNKLACGVAVYHKTAAGGVESPVFNAPDGSSNLFAHGIIIEYSTTGTWSYDSTASSSAVKTDNTGGSSTGTTVPNTGTLAQSDSAVVTVLALMAGTGLSNANFAFSGGSWTTDATDNNTSTSVGTKIGDKVVSATTALGAVYTWTTDSTIVCFQAVTAVFSDTPNSTSVALTGSAVTGSRGTQAPGISVAL